MSEGLSAHNWSAASEYLARLLDPAAIGAALEQAERSWIAHVITGAPQPDLPEDVIILGHQATLLTRYAPVRMSDWHPELLTRVNDLASAISLSARLGGERQVEFARLAAHLFSSGLQPTRALQTAQHLRRASPDDRLERDLLRDLNASYRLGGATTAQEVLGALAAHVKVEANLRSVLAALATSGDAHAFRIAREIESALAERVAHDVRASVSGYISESYLTTSYAAEQRWRRRTELLPPQYEVLAAGFLADADSVVTTPTGTGKTYLAELRIAAVLSRSDATLAVYVAPLNALARQVWRNLSARLTSLGDVTLWTGAYEIDTSASLGRVVVTTPEKLDGIIRFALTGDERSLELLERIALVIADEAHHVSSGARGITYEFLLTRLRMLKPTLQIVALSAVQPDLAPMARWIAGIHRSPASTHSIGWESSQVWDLLWQKPGDLIMRRDYTSAARLARPSKVKEASALLVAAFLRRSESVLVVETRRDWAQALAKELYDNYREYLETRMEANGANTEGAMARIQLAADEIGAFLYPDHPLVEYLKVGLAFHHAGLPPQVRRLVEELARREIVHTVVSTTTLAEGIDLPFRAVVLCRLALPYGEPLRRARIRNIRGRAARPSYSSDGLFVVVEPEKTDTAAYQYFLDHYWESTVDTVESQSGLIELFAVDRLRQAAARRSLQRQLLAVYSEQDFEYEEIDEIARSTLLQIATGADSGPARGLREAIRTETHAMLQRPALLKVASPVDVTDFGRAAVLGGLSAASALMVRGRLTGEVDRLTSMTAQDPANAAIRASYLPWEAVEASEKYRELMMRRSGPGFVRDPERIDVLNDDRLSEDYRRAELLLLPLTFEEIAMQYSADVAVKGKGVNERVAGLVEWAHRVGGVLPWALSGVLRVGESLQVDEVGLQGLLAVWAPYVTYMSSWVASPAIGDFARRGVIDRDTAIQLLRGAELWNAAPEDLIGWLYSHQADAVALVGERQVLRLMAGVPDLDEDEDE